MTQDERREYLIQYLLKEEIPFGRDVYKRQMRLSSVLQRGQL